MARFIWAGESHLLVEFGRELDPADNRNVHNLAARLLAMKLPGIRECVPAFGSLMISLEPMAISGEEIVALCDRIIDAGCDDQGAPPLVMEIPVLYGGDFGPDLQDVADETGLSEEEVILLHTEQPYLVYMIGFMPGFAYLGGVNARLYVPRLQKPRTKVPSGSVAIAERFTGIYPINSPGGWRLIGRTPLPLFMPEQEMPTLLRPGQYVRFVAVDARQYASIESDVAASRYAPTVYLQSRGGTA